MNIFIRALLAGLLAMIIGTLASFLVGFFFKVELPPVCESWNKNLVMEQSLFLTGFFLYLALDCAGLVGSFES